MVGVVLALVISFEILIFAWRKAAVPLHRRAPTARTDHVFDHPIVQIIARALVFATYAWAGLAMMAGQDLLTNPIFGFLLVWMGVGLVPSRCYSASSGVPPNPLRTIHRVLCAVARIDAEQGLVTLPAGMGWPAAVGLFGFGWLELVRPDRTTLLVLRLCSPGW